MRKLFENTRVEIRTFGHLIESGAYSIYFYFDPRFGFGYFTEKVNNIRKNIPKNGMDAYKLLKHDMQDKRLHFKLHKVTEREVKESLNKGMFRLKQTTNFRGLFCESPY